MRRRQAPAVRPIRIVAVLAAMAALAAGASRARAQAPAPENWRWQLDGPAHLISEPEVPADSWRFVESPPGWHVTMGPGGVIFEPSHWTDGRFTVEARMILFPEASDSEYGLALGISHEPGQGEAYTSFVVRADGSAAVLRHEDGRVTSISPWTKHAAVARRSWETASNLVRVEAGATEVVYSINGQEAVRLPRSSLSVDGGVGFRVGAGVDVHIMTLDLTDHLAPVPRIETY